MYKIHFSQGKSNWIIRILKHKEDSMMLITVHICQLTILSKFVSRFFKIRKVTWKKTHNIFTTILKGNIVPCGKHEKELVTTKIKIHGKFVHPKVWIVNADIKISLHELVHTKKWNVHHKEKFPHNGTNLLVKLILLRVKHWWYRQIVESLLHVHVLWKIMAKCKAT
jgi:hypothetical protein